MIYVVAVVLSLVATVTMLEAGLPIYVTLPFHFLIGAGVVLARNFAVGVIEGGRQATTEQEAKIAEEWARLDAKLARITAEATAEAEHHMRTAAAYRMRATETDRRLDEAFAKLECQIEQAKAKRLEAIERRLSALEQEAERRASYESEQRGQGNY